MIEVVERAELLMGQKRWKLAEAELRRVLTHCPTSSYAHAMLAQCVAMDKRYEEATSEAEEAVHLAPDDAYSHIAMAQVLCQRRRFREAKPFAQEAVRLNPDVAETWRLLAGTAVGLRQWPEVLTAAMCGLRLDPDDPHCAHFLFLALMHLDRNSEAVAVAADTLARDPEQLLSQTGRGWALLLQGDCRQAGRHFREALRIEPESRYARVGMITALKAGTPIYRLMLGTAVLTKAFTVLLFVILFLGIFGSIHVIISSLGWQRNEIVTPAAILLAACLAPMFLRCSVEALSVLMLRVHPFGKHALSRDEILLADIVGLCIVALVLGIIVGVLGGVPWAVLAALGCMLFVVPCSAVFRCPRGWPRRIMSLYCLGLMVLGILALAGNGLDLDALKVCGGLFFLGVFLSSWVANGLMTATVRS